MLPTLIEWWPVFSAAVLVVLGAMKWAHQMHTIQIAQLRQLAVHNKILLKHKHKEDGSVDIDPASLHISEEELFSY